MVPTDGLATAMTDTGNRRERVLVLRSRSAQVDVDQPSDKGGRTNPQPSGLLSKPAVLFGF